MEDDMVLTPSQVMACLITQHYPPLPPYPQRIRVQPIDPRYADDDDDSDAREQPRPAGGDAAEHVPFPDPDAELDGSEVQRHWIRVWSYGGYLLDDRKPEYRRVDRDLRLLVARCLCNDPYYRPRLAELEFWVPGFMRLNKFLNENSDADDISDVDSNDSGINPADNDDNLQQWADDTFGKAPSHTRR
jgi:hypothetical protein